MSARLLYSPRKQKQSTLIQIVHFPFSRVPEASGSEPEVYRKLTGKLTGSFLFYRSSGSSRKVSGRLTGSLPGSCCFMRVPEGSRKVSGRPSGSKIIIRYPKQVNVSSLIRVHLPCLSPGLDLRVWLSPQKHIVFLILLFKKLIDSCLGGPRIRFNDLGTLVRLHRKQSP